MKKISVLLLAVAFLSVAVSLTGCKQVAKDKKRDVRAVWITTVFNKDWPAAKNDAKAQQQEFIKILDDISALGFNTVIVQIRPKGDALYKSAINPWSDVLTGVQGQEPGYDPLMFMIEEAHKRNLEFHAWLNPYRVTILKDEKQFLAADNLAVQQPELIIVDNDKLYYNPGLPAVRQYIIKTVEEIVQNYDVDGIHFDDYFYPSKNIDDSKAYAAYGAGKSLEEFRLDSVNKLVEEVNKAIKTIKPAVKFGISPAGVWKNKENDVAGSDTKGHESYYELYCDTIAWVKNGWIDYVVPQLYWTIGHKNSDYAKLAEWWNSQIKNEQPQLYIGQGIYKDEIATEVAEQLKINEKYSNIKGSVYFTYSDIRENRQGIRDKLKILYKEPAIPYTMSWLNNTVPPTPEAILTDNKGEKVISIVNNSLAVKYYLIYRFAKNEQENLNNPAKIIGKLHNSGESVTEYRDTADGDYYYVVTALTGNHVESLPKKLKIN